MTNIPNPIPVDMTNSPYARLRPLPMTAVQIDDTFWAPRRAINRDTTLTSQFQHLEATGAMDNFRRASGKKNTDFQGMHFSDSDVYKWLEAASWALAEDHSASLEEMVDAVLTEIADAQQTDGYLHTYFMFDKAPERWTTIDTGPNHMHELYCAGHFFQAAVAHCRSTGQKRALEIAVRLADHICDVFGFGEGQRNGTDGHPEIEMALVELWRATANPRYLAQAEYFVDVRLGMGRINPAEQTLKPFRELTRMEAHAVCAAYLTAGVTDIYAENGEPALKLTLDKLWDNMTDRQLYITGGIGSRYGIEAFGDDYELPAKAYAETCAAIASVMWNWRMLLVTGEARYADLMEHTLYNAVLPGLSLDGQQYFYQNPLTSGGGYRRREWFGCACCPPNVARTLAMLPGFFATVTDNSLWLHQYAAGCTATNLPDGTHIALTQATQYPWDGLIEITFDHAPAMEVALHLRIPSWADGATVSVNGDAVNAPLLPNSYAILSRIWKAGDHITLLLPMPVRRMVGHPRIADTVGRVALMRGPLVYCLEQTDFDNVSIASLSLSSNELTPELRPGLLGGIVTLHGQANAADMTKWDNNLYRASDAPTHLVPLTAVPYYAWANREDGPMTVWILRG